MLTVEIIAGMTPPEGEAEGLGGEEDGLVKDARNDSNFGIIDLNALNPESESSRNNLTS